MEIGFAWTACATAGQPPQGGLTLAAERERRPKLAPRSGRRAKGMKMVALEARHGPARPVVRRWLASFLIDMVFR